MAHWAGIILHDKFLTKPFIDYVINTMAQHDFDHSLLHLQFVSLQWQMAQKLASTELYSKKRTMSKQYNQRLWLQFPAVRS
jgi:hypothetical protein